MFCLGSGLQVSRGQDCGPNLGRHGWFPGQRFQIELLFLDFLYQRDAPNRHRRRLESFEPEHRPEALLYSPVVLLDPIIEVLAGASLHGAR